MCRPRARSRPRRHSHGLRSRRQTYLPPWRERQRHAPRPVFGRRGLRHRHGGGQPGAVPFGVPPLGQLQVGGVLRPGQGRPGRGREARCPHGHRGTHGAGTIRRHTPPVTRGATDDVGSGLQSRRGIGKGPLRGRARGSGRPRARSLGGPGPAAARGRRAHPRPAGRRTAAGARLPEPVGREPKPASPATVSREARRCGPTAQRRCSARGARPPRGR